MKLSSVYAPIIGRTIGNATSHHSRSSLQPSIRPACSSSSGTRQHRLAEQEHAEHAHRRRARGWPRRSSSSRCGTSARNWAAAAPAPGTSIVASMTSMSTLRPAKLVLRQREPAEAAERDDEHRVRRREEERVEHPDARTARARTACGSCRASASSAAPVSCPTGGTCR